MNVLNHDKQVQHGAQNWAFVSCAHRDIHLGEYNCHHDLYVTIGHDNYISVDIMAP
jgi:hypothetical protein